MYAVNSNFDDEIHVDNTTLEFDKCILNYSGGVQPNPNQPLLGSYFKNSCLNPLHILDSNISGINIRYLDPKYNNVAIGDYRLKLNQTNGSPLIEFVDNSNIASGVTISLDNYKLDLTDSMGNINHDLYSQFVYVQDSTIVLSDYNKETKWAEFANDYKNLDYKIRSILNFSEYNVRTVSSLSINDNEADPYPYDWDYKKITSTKIGDEYFIIPRSVISVEDIINTKINTVGTVFYRGITKNNITVLDNRNIKGVAFDAKQSNVSESVTWLIDGNNQTLIKQNVFTGTAIETYPLLCPSKYKGKVKPSGVIYVGVDGERAKFLRSDDPNQELFGSEGGEFSFLPTLMNTKYDLRGVTVYNDNLFITASEYQLDVNDRTIVPSGVSFGRLLQYYSNDLFYNYIKFPGQDGGPIKHSLSLYNKYPTDITKYEDGSLLVADYYSQSGIFKYRLAYDYAMISTSYDNETRVLLREFYTDVRL
jgi:hypothetical protein